LIRKLTKAKRLKPTKLGRFRQGRLLYLAAIPMFVSTALALVKGDYGRFITNGIGFLLLLGSAGATAKGLENEQTYHTNAIAKAPAVPYKTIAMVLTGISVLYLSFVAGGKPLGSSLFVALLTSVGYGLYYGLDPRKDKLPDMGDISPELVLKTLNEAREKLARAEAANAQIADRTLRRKIDQAIEQAHRILEAIQHDPKDLRVARKFLVVFIDGIADVTRTYTEVDTQNIDDAMRKRLYTLIDDVQSRFNRELARLKANNLFDLDVAVEALQTQINH
jgi:hypothetical protein